MADGGGRVRCGLYPGWAIVGIGFLLQFIASGPVYYAFGSYAPSIAAAFEVPRTLVNLAYSMVVFVGAVGSAPVGWLIDRLSVRVLALFGLGGTALGLLLVGLANAYWQVLILFSTLIAAGEIFIGNLMVNYLISHWFERRRGLAIGLAVVGASAAAIAFPPIASALVEQIGWRMTMAALAAMVAVCLPVCLWVRIPVEMPVSERRAGDARRETASSHRFTARDLMVQPAFWIVILCTGSMIGINGAVMITMVPYAQSLGLSGLQGAAMLSLVGVGAIAGKLGFGLVADRVDLCEAQRLGLVMMALGLSLLTGAGSFAAGHAGLLVAAFVYGLALGGMMPVWGALVAHVWGLGSYGTILGYSRAAMTPLAMGCPLIAGAAFDLTGAYQPAFLTFVALLALVLAATWMFKGWAQPLV